MGCSVSNSQRWTLYSTYISQVGDLNIFFPAGDFWVIPTSVKQGIESIFDHFVMLWLSLPFSEQHIGG